MRKYKVMRITSILAIIFLAIMVSGCGSKSLVNVWNENISDPEKVWEATALKGFNPDAVTTITAVLVAVHPMWLGDGLDFTPTMNNGDKKFPSIIAEQYGRR